MMTTTGDVKVLTSSTVLDAPGLRDDFYCSVLAYSHAAHRLAVGLGHRVYLWSEFSGVKEAPQELQARDSRLAYITSLAFSSEQGRRGILATGRCDGRLVLYSPLDKEQRFMRMMLYCSPVHISFRPTTVQRSSLRHAGCSVDMEMLLIGDESGMVSIYLIEWPREKERHLFGWHGGVSLHARIITHTQQICGISWSPDGAWFATGGNDNLCCLFDISTIMNSREQQRPAASRLQNSGGSAMCLDIDSSQQLSEPALGHEVVKYSWRISAAVKAIAFCPWQQGLIAFGGGSNDRRIHFCHYLSGACLAKIDCAAQVTSLVWSKTRREIAATLGFAQPEHPFRIVVYAWPTCDQVVAIPWRDDMRALFAIPYPGGPDVGRMGCEGGVWGPRTREEGCIAIAASDCTIKFHEIWGRVKKAVKPRHGSLFGSDVLEGLHDIEKDGLETIR